jgi:membrane protein
MLRRLLRLYGQKRGGTLAAAAAFYAFFSLLPITLLVLSIISFAIGTSEESLSRAASSFSALTPEGSESMAGTLRRLSHNRELVGLFGLVFGVVGGSTLLMNLRSSFLLLFDQESKAHFLVIRAKAAAGTLGIGALLTFGAAAPLFVALRQVQKVLNETALADIQFGVQVAQEILFALAASLFFGIAYRCLCPLKSRLGPLVLASVSCGVAWAICRKVFALYVAHSVGGSLYGPLGSVFFVLAWMYLSFALLFLGGCYLRLTSDQHGA